jgi:hypothetical protein
MDTDCIRGIIVTTVYIDNNGYHGIRGIMNTTISGGIMDTTVSGE